MPDCLVTKHTRLPHHLTGSSSKDGASETNSTCLFTAIPTYLIEWKDNAMMDTSTLSAGLAWAVPVKPDILGKHLEAYKHALPQLRTLKLCHRFGKGEDAHIARLPLEILIFIEDLVLCNSRNASSDEWVTVFRHFESRCRPRDHGDYGCDSCGERFFETGLCESCEESESFELCDKCEAARDEAMDECVSARGDGEWRFEECQGHGDRWKDLVDQAPQGNFTKYDKVCQKGYLD